MHAKLFIPACFRQVCCGPRDPGDTGGRHPQPTLLPNSTRVQSHVHQRSPSLQGHVGILLFRGVGLDSADFVAGSYGPCAYVALKDVTLSFSPPWKLGAHTNAGAGGCPLVSSLDHCGW